MYLWIRRGTRGLMLQKFLEKSENVESEPLQEEEEYYSLGLAYGKIVS